MRVRAAALRATGTGRLLLGLAGVWQFLAHVPSTGWLRVAVWLAAGVVVHDGVLAPLGVVSGRVVGRRSPERARPVLRIAGLALLTVALLAVPLLATGGLRR